MAPKMLAVHEASTVLASCAAHDGRRTNTNAKLTQWVMAILFFNQRILLRFQV
jgi:hypothetical protein